MIKITCLDDARLKANKQVGLKRLREDPVIFIRQMFGDAVQPWQLEMLRELVALDNPCHMILSYARALPRAQHSPRLRPSIGEGWANFSLEEATLPDDTMFEDEAPAPRTPSSPRPGATTRMPAPMDEIPRARPAPPPLPVQKEEPEPEDQAEPESFQDEPKDDDKSKLLALIDKHFPVIRKGGVEAHQPIRDFFLEFADL